MIGKRDAIAARYRLQWLTIVEGYAVDAALAVLFFLMALMACCLWPVARNPAYLWLAMALVLSGIQRGNQAFFFWWEIETIQGFVVVIVSLTASLSLGAWTMAWRGWFTVDRPAWLPQAIAALTLILIAAQLLARPWLFTATFPRALSLAARYLITVGRLGFLLVFVLIAFEGLRRRRRERWHALPILTALAVVLFSSEVAAMGVRGIWFPWGIGVSLSEYASVVFDALLFMLLVRRLWADARPIPAEGAIGRNVSRAAGQIDTRQR